MSGAKYIANFSEEYDYNSLTNLTNENCTHSTLYKDTFVFTIENFTYRENGHYWCQIVVNSTYLLPSQHAQFYAADPTFCSNEPPFTKLIETKGELQCTGYSTMTSSTFSVTTSSVTTLSVTTSSEIINSQSTIYGLAIGVLLICLLTFGASLVTSLFCGLKLRRNYKKGQSLHVRT